MINAKLSRKQFIDKVRKSGFKNGTEFKVFDGEKEIGIVGVQRTIVVYVNIPHDIFDLLTNDKYQFLQII